MIVLLTKIITENNIMIKASMLSLFLSLFFSVTCRGQTVDETIRQLQDADPAVRRMAAEKLGKEQVQKAIPELCQLLKDRDQSVSNEAVNALSLMGKGATPALVDLLGTKVDENCQLRILTTLGKLGSAAEGSVPILIKQLEGAGTDVRIYAAVALGKIGFGAKEALPALFKAGKDTSNVGPVIRMDLPSSVCVAAIAAAKKIDPGCVEALAKEVLSELIKALQSPDQGKLFAAETALGELGKHAKPAASALLEAEKNAKGFSASTIATVLETIGARSPFDLITDAKRPVEKRLAALSELRYGRNRSEESVKAMTALLKDANPKIRRRSAEILGGWAPDSKAAIPELVSVLGDMELERANPGGYSDERDIVATALSQFGRLAVDDLAGVLKDSKNSAFKRWNAAKGLALLGRLSESALPVLKQTVHDRYVVVGIESSCAYVLAGGDFAYTKSPLDDGLKQKEEFLIYQTVTAIERIGYRAKALVPQLQPLLEHKEREIRIRAAYALCQMKEAAKPAVPKLGELLSSKDSRERLQISMAVEHLGGEAVDLLPALVKQMKTLENMMPNPILATVGKMGSAAKGTVPELMKLISSDKMYSRDAIVALGEIGPDAAEAVPELTKLLLDKSEYTRGDAAIALGQIGPKAQEANTNLKKLLSDSRKGVRVKAMFALIKINQDAATYMPQLIKMWNEARDTDEIGFNVENVRSEIAEVWARLGREARPAKEIMVHTIGNRKTSLGVVNFLCKALAKQSDDRELAVSKLTAVLNEPDDQKNQKYRYVHAMVALGMIGPDSKQSITALQKLTKFDDKQVVELAYETLEKIGGK